MKGVILKVQQLDGLSPTKILNLHIAKARDAGRCYYATAIPFCLQKKDLDSVIFFFQAADKTLVFVQADLSSLSRRQDGKPFRPDDCEEFSPAVFAPVPRSSWLMLQNFRRVDLDFVSSLYTLPGGSVEQQSVAEVIRHSCRVNRVYWTDEIIPDEDVLLV